MLRRIAIFLLLSSLSNVAFAESESAPDKEFKDPCDWQEVGLRLKKIWKEAGQFKGEFEIKPWQYVNQSEPFVFSGTRTRKGFYMSYPHVFLHFADANGTWNFKFEPPGTFFAPPDRLSIVAGNSGTVIVDLPSPELAAEASEWKVAIRDEAAKVCVWSVPLRVLQKRGPVTGFKSDPAPDWLFKEATATPCDIGARKSMAAADKSVNSKQNSGCSAKAGEVKSTVAQ